MTTTNQIYWIASLLESEGHFRFLEGPRIHFASTDLDIVLKAKEILKISTGINTVMPRGVSRKILYNFSVNGSLAIQWMQMIYPLMSVRRKEKIREILMQWKLMSGNPKSGNKKVADHTRLINMLAVTNKISYQAAEIMWEKISNPVKTE